MRDQKRLGTTALEQNELVSETSWQSRDLELKRKIVDRIQFFELIITKKCFFFCINCDEGYFLHRFHCISA